MPLRLRVLLLAWCAGLAAGCGCVRQPSLAAHVGDLVVVVPTGDGELLTREATLTVPDVAMEDVGESPITLRNLGGAPVTVTDVTRVEGDFFELEGLAGAQLDGEDLVGIVRFAPPQAADPTSPTQPHRALFTLELSGTRPEEARATVEVLGAALARDCYVPATVDFGDVPVGQRVSIPFVLENGKAVASTTTFGAVGGADPALFELGAGPVEVPPGQRVEVPLWFGPLAEVASSASVEVRRSGCAPVTVQLLGRGLNTALSWAPTSLDFGRIPLGMSSLVRAVTVSNRSNATLALTAEAFSLGDFVVSAAPASVPPRGTASFQLACAPRSLGVKNDVFAFSIGAQPPLQARLAVRCQGGGPQIHLTPQPLSMGSVPFVSPGQVATVRRLSVQNVGTPPLAPGDTTNNLLLGVNGRPPFVGLTALTAGTSASEFEVSLPVTYDAVAGLPAVALANTADLEVRFKPATAGPKYAELVVYSNDSLTPMARVRVSANATVAAPCTSLLVSPAVLAFGTVPRGGVVERTLTVTNPDAAPCTATGFDMTPGSSAVFTVPNPGATLTIGAGAQRSVRVRATIPGTIANGATERGYLRFFSTASLNPVVTVPTEVRVSSCLQLTPSELDFGSTGMGCRSGELAVTAYNTCASPLTLDSLTVAPGPFSIDAAPPAGMDLAPGSPTSVALSFVPSGVGPALGALRVVATEAGVTSTTPVVLRGVGTPTADHVDSWVQGPSAIDILFVVDNSCSMSDEQVSLATNFSAFIGSTTTATTDFRIAVTTTDVFADNGAFRGSPAWLTPTTPGLAAGFAARTMAGISGSGYEQPLEALLRALSPPMSTTGANQGFLRPGVPLAAVIVTDAVDQSPNPVDAYVAALRALKANQASLVNVSVVGPFTPASSVCHLDTTVDNGRYAQVVTTTGGVRADICTTDWARDLDAIGRKVMTLRTRFQLGAVPDPGGTMTVTVDGTPASGWQYDASSRTLTFGSPPPAGATVAVAYRTVCRPP